MTPPIVRQYPGLEPYELRQLGSVRTTASASQLDLHGLCARRYAFRYLTRIPKPPQHPAAAMGSALHAAGERYQKQGVKPDYTDQAAALFMEGLPYLPPPGAGVATGGGAEGEFTLNIQGLDFVLHIDYLGGQVPGFDPNTRVVLDLKTSSNPKAKDAEGGKGAKRLRGLWGREAFLEDYQALIYAASDLIRSGDPQAHLRWLYFWTKGRPRAEPSDATLARAEAEDRFGQIVYPRAREVYRLKTLPAGVCDPNDVEPDTRACAKFPVTKEQREQGLEGGCPYKKYCRLTSSDYTKGALQAFNISTKTENRQMPNGDILSQMMGGGAPASAPTQPAPAPTQPAQQPGQLPATTQPAPPTGQPLQGYTPNQTQPPFTPPPGQGQDVINPPETYQVVGVQAPPSTPVETSKESNDLHAKCTAFGEVCADIAYQILTKLR